MFEGNGEVESNGPEVFNREELHLYSLKSGKESPFILLCCFLCYFE